MYHVTTRDQCRQWLVLNNILRGDFFHFCPDGLLKIGLGQVKCARLVYHSSTEMKVLRQARRHMMMNVVVSASLVGSSSYLVIKS